LKENLILNTNTYTLTRCSRAGGQAHSVNNFFIHSINLLS